jgi:cytochrome o ubiquinol oxidase subunit II
LKSGVLLNGRILRTSAVFVTLFLGGCSGVLDPHGPIGGAERTILLNATVIMLAVVVPVIVCTLLFAWWFRAGNRRARRMPDWSYAGRIEFVVWAIPVLVILFLGGIAWIGSHDLDPQAPLHGSAPPLDIEVVSLEWKWLFIYPSLGVASVNRLVVPVGVPLRFRLTSSGVMNSFFIPQLGSQIYTMAGMETQLNLQAADPGDFKGLSAQFSGNGFSDMLFEVSAVQPDAFAQWLAATRAQGGSLDSDRYAVLSQPSQKEPPITFGAVSEGLFEAILASPGAAPRDAAAQPMAERSR